MIYIGIGINKDETVPFPFTKGDRLVRRQFRTDQEAIEFVEEQWAGSDRLTHMLLLEIGERKEPRVVAVFDLRQSLGGIKEVQ